MAIRILLVDDNVEFRSVIGKFLDEEAADVQVVGYVGDGNAAIQQVQALKPDVISIDVKMPNVDGVEAISRILNLVPTVKMLALSLHRHVELIQSMINAGASGYVLKDDAYEELIPASMP